jgi:hypothetical protein
MLIAGTVKVAATKYVPGVVITRTANYNGHTSELSVWGVSELDSLIEQLQAIRPAIALADRSN